MRMESTPLFLRLAAIIAIISATFQVNAAVYNLTHKNSTATYDTDWGLTGWSIDGVNHLFYQTLFYRIGSSGPETLVSSIPSPTQNSFLNIPNLSLLDLTYANATFSVRSSFQLVGQNPGTGRSSLSESITVQNLSSSTIDFHLFQYADFDLGGADLGQSLQFIPNSINGQYYQVVQTDGTFTYTSTITSAGTSISHFEAGFYPSLISSLQDGNPTTLNDNPSAGVGDVAYGYQWTVSLAPNQAFQISKLTTIVPEPSALALLGLSAVSLWVRRCSRNIR